MEAETTLVDYSYGSSSPRTAPFRASDVDFRDVFGGPPRRSSIHEMMRCSFTEGVESLPAGRRMGEMPSFRDPWTGAEEKPVFGGGVEGGTRRRDLREDFFVDIFGGSESPGSTTPRKHDLDVFSSSPPASRPLSPAWLLPPRAEGFGGPSSVPTQFSLPGKLSNSVDSTPFGSPTRTSHKDAASNRTSRPHSPKISVFGFSSRPVQVHDESRSTGAHYRPSPLSRQFSLGKENSLGLNKHENSVDLEKEMGNARDVTSSPQFHFSIYKWASKGIPIMMPLTRARSRRSQEKGRTESLIFNEMTETSDEVENQSPGNFSSKVELQACQRVENEVPSRKQDVLGSGWNNNLEDIPVIPVPKDKDGKSSSPSLANSRESLEKEMNGGLSRPELKPLHAFFLDKDEKQGNTEDAIDGKASGASRMERSSKGLSGKDKNVNVFKKSNEELLVRRSEEAKKVVSKGSPRNSEDGTGKKRSKGKVKEFIKIFSQESSSAKLKASVHPQRQSFTKEEKGTPAATLEAISHKNLMINERISVSQLEKPVYDSNKVADPHKESPEEHSSMDNADILFSDTSSGRKDNSASSPESATDDMRTTDEDGDESFRAYFTIKELPQDENKQGQPTEDREEIQAIDAKIRQWSRGKEGNIRSLLSTLQYVLWPGSGWRPVPLVDIIEGPAVKRAYQRALLCLHPDKLQQKGAASEQKHIAEKVFDILQESWTNFNTIGAL